LYFILKRYSSLILTFHSSKLEWSLQAEVQTIISLYNSRTSKWWVKVAQQYQQDPTGFPSQMNSFYGGDNMMNAGGGERVKVALRVRRIMPHEYSRGDENIATTPDT